MTHALSRYLRQPRYMFNPASDTPETWVCSGSAFALSAFRFMLSWHPESRQRRQRQKIYSTSYPLPQIAVAGNQATPFSSSEDPEREMPTADRPLDARPAAETMQSRARRQVVHVPASSGKVWEDLLLARPGREATASAWARLIIQTFI
jgi:hypothetical protein